MMSIYFPIYNVLNEGCCDKHNLSNWSAAISFLMLHFSQVSYSTIIRREACHHILGVC